MFGSFLLTFGLCFWAYRIQFTQPQLADFIGIASFSLVFFGTAIAQLRSGYIWRNLSPGNRGRHRFEAPARFILSTALHFLIASLIIVFALWRFTHPA